MTHQTHKLATWPQYWDAVHRGEKTFEVRRDDRGFQRGDILELQRCERTRFGTFEVEMDFNGYHPKHVIRKEITYILTGGQFGIEPGYVVMGLGEVNP
ncbi:MAG: DUF3850 domain-containing protein [Caulobacteraceae bacterium]|nr:DUF3850 domain-containing protein [Caulobacteraceae bacterium]